MVPVKSKVGISQNLVVFSECMNFNKLSFLKYNNFSKQAYFVEGVQQEIQPVKGVEEAA